jgi:hypothetical protein
MRRLLLGMAGLGFALGAARAADARCSSHFVQVFHDGGSLPRNGRIIVQGSIMSAKWVAAMQDPELISGNEHVPLSVVEPYMFKNTGRDFAQMVLVPQKPLTEGKTYRLAVKNVDTQDRDAIARTSFRITAGDTQAPTWNNAPKVLATNHAVLGCGPSTTATIGVDATDNGQPVTLYRVHFKERGTNTAVDFYVEAERGALRVGRGMCGGPAEPVPGKAYEISVTAVDDSGNLTPAPGAPLLAQF